MTNSVADLRRCWVGLASGRWVSDEGSVTIKAVVECLEKLIDEQRLDFFAPFPLWDVILEILDNQESSNSLWPSTGFAPFVYVRRISLPPLGSPRIKSRDPSFFLPGFCLSPARE